ncbi:MAG: NADP-dependent glyceraldehyde-3-phosphate dehydrogenase [Streptobacillus sp.]
METIKIYSPINNEYIGEVEKMSKEDVDKKYIEARKSFIAWKSLSTVERAKYIYKAADELEKMKEEVADIMTREISKSYKDSLNEVERTVYLMKYSAEEGMRIFGEVYEGGSYDAKMKNKIAIIRREAMGVVLAIAPYNYPVNLSASKIAPALIGGNVVIFKPPTQGALCALKLIEAFEKAGLPKGVLQAVTGKGSEIGDYLNTHEEIDFINFTGSTEIGQKIGMQAGMKPILLELGGKDAGIVLEDANLELAASEIVTGAYSYSGQRCTAIKRVLVREEVADELVLKLKEKVEKLTIGNPFDNVDIVPLIDEKSAIFVEELVKDAISKGANLLTEFKREGNLLTPVLLDNVTLNMDIAWVEPFGPVLPVIRFKTDEDILKVSNDSEYGLQSSVFTQNIDRAFDFASKLEVGTVHINNKTQRGPDNFPFLGIKNSGTGVQGIRQSILSMTKVKNIVINI